MPLKYKLRFKNPTEEAQFVWTATFVAITVACSALRPACARAQDSKDNSPLPLSPASETRLSANDLGQDSPRLQEFSRPPLPNASTRNGSNELTIGSLIEFIQPRTPGNIPAETKQFPRMDLNPANGSVPRAISGAPTDPSVAVEGGAGTHMSDSFRAADVDPVLAKTLAHLKLEVPAEWSPYRTLQELFDQAKGRIPSERELSGWHVGHAFLPPRDFHKATAINTDDAKALSRAKKNGAEIKLNARPVEAILIGVRVPTKKGASANRSGHDKEIHLVSFRAKALHSSIEKLTPVDAERLTEQLGALSRRHSHPSSSRDTGVEFHYTPVQSPDRHNPPEYKEIRSVGNGKNAALIERTTVITPSLLSFLYTIYFKEIPSPQYSRLRLQQAAREFEKQLRDETIYPAGLTGSIVGVEPSLTENGSSPDLQVPALKVIVRKINASLLASVPRYFQQKNRRLAFPVDIQVLADK